MTSMGVLMGDEISFLVRMFVGRASAVAVHVIMCVHMGMLVLVTVEMAMGSPLVAVNVLMLMAVFVLMFMAMLMFSFHDFLLSTFHFVL